MRKKNTILFKLIWKYKYLYLLGLITLLIVDYVNLFIPQFTGEITDGLASHLLDFEGVVGIIIKLMIASGILTIGRVLWRFFIFGSSRKIEQEIRNSLFTKLETLSQSYFNYHKTGDLMAHFTNDLEALRNAIGPAIISAFDAVVMTVMVLYKMMRYVDVKLTLMTLVPMSIIAYGGYQFGEVVEKRFADKQEAFSSLSDYIQESISGERVIKAFTQEKHQSLAFMKVNTHNFNMNMKVVQLMATFMPMLDFIIGVTYVIALVYGGYLTLINQITLGRFIAFTQYIGMLVWPMIALGDSLTTFSQGRAALSRLNQVFDEISDIQDSPDAQHVTLTGEIDFKNVTFSYGNAPVLKNIDLHIKQGETLAIIGRLGSGKTTLVNLLARLYDTQEGEILLNGYPIQKIFLEDLRSQLAYVPQDSFLFSDTLENNLAFGLDHVDQEKIIQACQDACIHDNIIDFPEGYQTMVGERGVTLSGGQKQRTSIARALLKDSPILILDDALSAVDTDTEEQILENLKRLRKDKTTLIIAHRISTIMNADHILVLEEGNMAEYGTFDELMKLDGIFAQMYEKQQLEKQLATEGGFEHGENH